VDLRLVGRALLASEPLLERDGGNAQAVVQADRLDAVGVEEQLAVAPARADHDRGAVGFLLGREERGDRGVVDVLDPIVLGLLRLVAAALEAGRPPGAQW